MSVCRLDSSTHPSATHPLPHHSSQSTPAPANSHTPSKSEHVHQTDYRNDSNRELLDVGNAERGEWTSEEEEGQRDGGLDVDLDEATSAMKELPDSTFVRSPVEFLRSFSDDAKREDV